MHEAVFERCKQLEALRPDLRALRVDARVNWLSDKDLVVHIEYYLTPGLKNRQSHMLWSFEAAETYLRALPGEESRKDDEIRVFTKDLAHLLERARELDVPVVADLEASMKNLSKNILPIGTAA